MLRGVFQRVAVAILLIGALVAPAGICLQQAQKSGHDCCARARNPDRPFRKTAALQGRRFPPLLSSSFLSVSVIGARDFVDVDEASSLNASPALAVIPPQSPPTGASILRI